MRARGMPVRGGHRSEIMGRESIWKLLYIFSGPAIISMLVTSSYNIADAIFVGRLGPEAIAGMAVSNPIIMLTMTIAMGTGVGAASLIGRNLGAGKREEANRIAAVAISTSTIISVLITIIYFLNADRLLGLFGASGSVMGPAKTYVSIVMAFTAVSKMSIVLSFLVRVEGRPVLSSAVQIASAIFNIITDPIFIFGWGPIPAYGIAGAAATTAASWVLGTGIYVVYFLTGKSSYHFKLSYFIPDLKIIKEIYRIGIASIARGAAGSTVQAMGNNIAASFGVITLAVKGVLMRASSFAFMPTMGIGTGVLPLVAYNYGAKQNGRVGEIVIKASLAGFIWGGVCFVFVQIFPSQLMSIFGNSPEFIAAATNAIRIFSLGFFTIGTQMIMSHYFQGVGDGMASLFLASSRQIIFLMPAYYILPRFFGVTGIWLSYAVADVLAFAVTVIWTLHSFRKAQIPITLKAQPVLVQTPVGAVAGNPADGKSRPSGEITSID